MRIEWQIKQQDPRFMTLSIDNEPWREVYKTFFIRQLHKLKEFKKREDFELEFGQIEQKAALNHCLKLLAAKSYTSFELKEKLLAKKIAAKAIDGAIERCIGFGYLNDKDLAERLIEQLRDKGKGDIYISLKLKKRLGYAPKIEPNAKKAREAICALIAKVKSKDDISDPKIKRRLIGKLLRRGFPAELIFESLNQSLVKESS
jgi:SOS response regulatory protein OraA/RecX